MAVVDEDGVYVLSLIMPTELASYGSARPARRQKMMGSQVPLLLLSVCAYAFFRLVDIPKT